VNITPNKCEVYVFKEFPENIHADIFVRFTINGKVWYFRGKPCGFIKEEAYIELPVQGSIQKFFHGDDIRDVPTKKFNGVPIQHFRMMWLYLYDTLEFDELEDYKEPTETDEDEGDLFTFKYIKEILHG
jgi:hypothetical protein